MIDDKQIGALWQWSTTILEIHPDCYRPVQSLIQKLVNERARYYQELRRSFGGPYKLDIEQALRDFGIDETTWSQP